MNGRNKQWMNQNMIFKYEKKANKYYHHMLNLYHKLGIKTCCAMDVYRNILIKASCTKFTADLGEVP